MLDLQPGAAGRSRPKTTMAIGRSGRQMTRSLGSELPDLVLQLLDGSQLAQREGLTFLLLTNDEENWPQVAMLSVGELVAIDSHSLRAALWLNSGSSRNLTRTGRATL